MDIDFNEFDGYNKINWCLFMCTQDQLQIIMKKIVKAYYDIYQDKICNIYLYGSYARGDFGADSDIDIVAIVKGNRRELQIN